MTGTLAIEKRLRAIAFHEAGHAVVAIVLGLRFVHVSIIPKEDSLGHVKWTIAYRGVRHRISPATQSTPRAGDFDLLGRYVSAYLAGNEAEKRATGRNNHVGADSDYQDVVDAALAHVGSFRQAEAWLEWRRVVAEELVEAYWHGVEAMADGLLKRGKLSEAQARRILGRASRKR